MSCAYRLEKAIQRLEGVDKVRVRMEPVRAEVTPRGGAWIEGDRLRRAVESAGFKPGDLRYTVTGTLTEWRGQPALRLAGSERVVLLRPQPATAQAYERVRQALPQSQGKKAEVEGQLADQAPPEDGAALAVLRVQRVEMGG